MVPTIATLTIFIAFIINTLRLPKEEFERTHKPWAWDPGERPHFWMNPFLEWCSFIALAVWLLIIVICCF